jgi:hypothetical protein
MRIAVIDWGMQMTLLYLSVENSRTPSQGFPGGFEYGTTVV